jgi:tetratricopeptide (TPR) repeat protein
MVSRLTKSEKAPRRSQEVCAIAVTPFWGNNESASQEGLVMQELLIRKLGEILGEDENTNIIATKRSKIPRSQAEARNLGRQLNASMVIWGEVVVLRDETEIQPHISIVYPLKTLQDQSPAALQTESTDPNQIRSRKMKAEEISTMAIYAAAEYLAEKDNYEKALAVVHTLPNTDSKRFILQGYLLSNLARDDEATEAYRKAALLDPKDPLPHLRMGWNFEMKRESYDEAFAEYEKAIATKPDYAWSYVALADFYASRAKTELALATLEKAIALAPQDEETNTYIAEVYHNLGRDQDAITQFKKAIAIAPQDPDLRCRLGIVYKDLGQYEKAIAEYESAISLAPQDPAPYSWIGAAYVEQERYKEAIEPFRRSLELHLTDFSVCIGLGISYGKLGNRDQAIKYFNKALEYGKSEFPELIHTFLASNYRDLGWNDSAIAEYKRAIECTADTQFADVGHYELAKFYDEIGDFEHALSEYRKASEIESNPDYSWYHLQYFVSLCRLGRQKEAQTYIHEYSRKRKKAKWRRDDVLSAVVDFYSGEISEEEVWKYAEREDSTSSWKCSGCQVNYYLAMPRLLTMELGSNSCPVDTVKALSYLEKSQVGCESCKASDYWKLAKIELQRLRKHLSRNRLD